MALTDDLTHGIREGQGGMDCWNLNEGMLGKAETAGVFVIIT